MSEDEEKQVARRYSCMTMAIAICEEFSFKVQFQMMDWYDYEIPAVVVMVHEKWLDELEYRLYKVNWIISNKEDWYCFKVLTAVDRASLV